jgi:arylformamidase
MIINLFHQHQNYKVDLSKGLDISIPLRSDVAGPKCFYAPDFKVEPVVAGDFIGSVEKGSPVNFKNVFVNPHGNGTHTECVGHISSEPISINNALTDFHFIARLVTVALHTKADGDKIIAMETLKEVLTPDVNTVVIRTLPNDDTKLTKDYSGTNPPYFSQEAILLLNQQGIKHLLTDLPSIDREEDGGALAGHKAFWNYPDLPATDKTITEMVYIENTIPDGLYFCNIQIISIESDASPSKIVLYPLVPIQL